MLYLERQNHTKFSPSVHTAVIAVKNQRPFAIDCTLKRHFCQNLLGGRL
jgi:hypothetical protein